MATGRVKWFNSQKGYGFIETAESGQDVFVHFSDIDMEGYKTLRENELVHFRLDDHGKGPSARQVRLVDQHHAPTAPHATLSQDVGTLHHRPPRNRYPAHLALR